MEQQSNKLAYLALILGLILLAIVIGWHFFGPKTVVSPIPEEGIKVIFSTPEPSFTPEPSESPSTSPTATPKATVKPTIKPTVKPTATPAT